MTHSERTWSISSWALLLMVVVAGCAAHEERFASVQEAEIEVEVVDEDANQSETSPPIEPPPGRWVLIKAGIFSMGFPPESPEESSYMEQREVELIRDFVMQATEVTQGQFKSVMGYNPSMYRCCGDDCPVESVSWHEAAVYCNELSARAKLESCYDCTGSPEVWCNELPGKIQDCQGYRLPTEAEWEYAARAGTTTGTYNGDPTSVSRLCETPALDPIAWYCGNGRVDYRSGPGCAKAPPGDACCSSGLGPHPVGQKRPNDWGLFDMLGNIEEWCHDPQGVFEKSAGGPLRDPVARATTGGRARGLRGGAFSWRVAEAQAPRRASTPSHLPRDDIGFRPVRTCEHCEQIEDRTPLEPVEPAPTAIDQTIPTFDQAIAAAGAVRGPMPEHIMYCSFDLSSAQRLTFSQLLANMVRTTDRHGLWCEPATGGGFQCRLFFVRFGGEGYEQAIFNYATDANGRILQDTLQCM